MESFSTHDVPASRKVSFWNEISSDTFGAMEVAPRDARSFDGQLSRVNIGYLTLMDVHSSAARVLRTRAHIARTTDASLLLLASLHRAFQLVVDNGPPMTVASGEFCVIDYARPYEIAHGDGIRVLCVEIPKRLVTAQVDQCERLTGRLMRADNPSARLLMTLLRAIGAEFRAESGASFGPETAQGLWNLILAAYAPDSDRIGRHGPVARAHAIRADIDANLNDPGLCPADVAARCGFSERYLRMALRSAGEPFSEYLLRRRLELCARLLRDPAWSGRTVTEIALYSGFSDPTHFGRCFKARYDITPRDYRRSTRC